jgi:hypothetical protein
MKFQVIAIDKNNERHVAEVLTNAEYVGEGAAGCATIARTFCLDMGLQFRDWRAVPVAANADSANARSAG